MKGQIPILFHESYFDQLYGAQKGLLRILEYIDRKTYRPLVVCPEEGLFTEEARKLDVAVSIVPLPPDLMTFGGEILRSSYVGQAAHGMKTFPQILRLVRLIKSHDVRLMHCNTIRSVLTSGLAAKLAGIPLIWHVKGDVLNGYLDHLASGLSDRLVAISEDVRTKLDARLLFNRKGKIVTVYDGVPVNIGSSVAAFDVRKEFGFSSEQLVVGTCASITPRKGYDVFLDMAKLVIRQCPEARFLIVGDITTDSDIAYRNQVLDQGRELINQGKLVFAGWRGDMPAVYASMDVFVLASSVEGLGLAVLEAMAQAKPTVRTMSAGASETVFDGVTGFLVPINEPRSMAAAVIRLIENEGMRVEFGLAGRDRVVNVFSIERMAQGIERVFFSSLAGEDNIGRVMSG